MDSPGYLFLITPPAGVNEEAFEKSSAEFLQMTADTFFQRVVSGTSHTLFKGKDEKERRKYLWRLELDTVGSLPVPLGSAFEELVKKLKEHFGRQGTVVFVTAVDEVVKSGRRKA